jgi:23S rRNA (uracil1939-C5)-methyltransferase
MVVERLIQGGQGLARDPGGKICLVPGVLPGETVDVEVTADHQSWIQGRLLGVDVPSPQRISPRCTYAAQCGGCPMSHVSDRVQVGLKVEILVDTLQRIGGIPNAATSQVVESPLTWGYRHRIKLHVDSSGRMGFFGHGSRDFVPIDRCLLAQDGIHTIQKELEGSRPWNRIRGSVSSLSITLDPGDAARATGVLGAGLKTQGISGALLETLVTQLNGVRGMTTFENGRGGKMRLRDIHLRCRYPADSLGLPRDFCIECPARCFTQINWRMNLSVIRRIMEVAAALGAERVLDLYSGIGNFSIPLALAGHSVVGIEQNPASVKAASDTARTLSAGHRVRFMRRAVEEAVEEVLRGPVEWDLVILDPPRTGAKRSTEIVARHRPRHILHLSCDPPTLARDIKVFRSSGYEIQRLEPYDFFPQTAHLEMLALLALDKPPMA